MKHTRHSQQGFSLIEISIVLVIIGLLLGGVLKGTELIENSKVRKAVAEINGITAAYYGYRDRYGTVPGDDGDVPALNARGGNWSSVTQAGNRNGQLTIPINHGFAGASESDDFWQHLRASGFITGDPSLSGTASVPRNAFGGLTSVINADTGGGLSGVKICMNEVPGKLASAMDAQLDDGQSDSGRMRANAGVSGGNSIPSNVAATAYNEDNVYVVCTTI